MNRVGLLAAALLAAGLATVASPQPAAAQSLDRYEFSVSNMTPVDVKHIYVTDLETGLRLGDRLVGRIVRRTSAVIDLSTANRSCRFALKVVFYDEDVANKRINVCSLSTLTLYED